MFAEPWQAQAFALAVRLNAEGLFTWPEWAAALARELASDPTDDGSRYYHHWVGALEALTAAHTPVTPLELLARKHDWAEAPAYAARPAGRAWRRLRQKPAIAGFASQAVCVYLAAPFSAPPRGDVRRAGSPARRFAF